MEEEHCDFDALAALLEDDSDNDEDQESQDAQPNEPMREQLQAIVQDGSESSDDDIDEDELDRLAGLMEADAEGESVAAAAKDETLDGLDNDGKHEMQREINVPDMNADDESVDEHVENDNDNSKVAAAEENDTDEEDDEDDVQAKIKKMYEMIQQLQSQVEKKPKKKKSPPAENKQAVTTTKTMTKTETVVVKETVIQSKVKKENTDTVSKQTPKANTVKLNNKDIFSQPTPEDPTRRINFNEAYMKNRKEKSSLPTGVKRESPSEENNKEETYTLKQAQEQLFGSDSDSDWEGMDGEKPSNLNPSGQDIKRIMKDKEKQRVAHAAKYDVSMLANRKPKWGSKDAYKPQTPVEGSSSYTRSRSPPRSRPFVETKESEEDKNVIREHFSGLKIINPRISSTEFRLRMEGRVMIPMSELYKKIRTSAMDQDWVTIGVLVQKSEPKMSSKGNQYSIWTLSDLKDCSKIVKMFLFGEVHKQHWKTSISSVIGFLNPSPMSNSNEKYQNKTDEIAFCIDNGNKVMLMGQSRDFGFCKSTTKAGNKCSNFVNKSNGEFCDYHISQEYKKRSAKRGDLQAGFSGPIPKVHQPSFRKKILGGTNETIFYGGQSISTSDAQKTKKGVNMSSIHAHDIKKAPLQKGKITTLSLFEIRPEDAEKLQKYEEKKKDQDNKAFHDLLATPSVGAMNLVKHLIGNEKKKEEKKQISFQTITAQDLLKEMKGSRPGRPAFSGLSSKSTTVCMTPSPSGMKLSASGVKPSSPAPAKPGLPQLGRGFAPGQDIFLDFDKPMKKPLSQVNSALIKQKAIDKIKKHGGIKKVDPNAVKKKLEEKDKQNIKKRVIEEQTSSNSEESENDQPRKKARLVGGINLKDPEIQKLLKKKSKHDNLLLDQEQEKQDEYFDALEKKEKMEQRLLEITQLKVKAVSCKQCNYTAQSANPQCKEQGHTLTTHEAKRRFFQCQHCKDRTASLQRFPTKACKCGKSAWQKASMIREKKGPKLETEDLLLRGEENKFLNSLQ